MANRRKSKEAGSGRDAGGFVALPWAVLDSDAWLHLSHPARSLLMELCRQYVRDNNGRLLASRAHLAKRGWKSADVIQRAKDELLKAGFIHETVKGQRPNRASWYALTFYSLDRLPGYDHGAAESFERGAYRKNASLSPSHGTESPRIVPSHGTEKPPPVPSHGTIRPQKHTCSVPSHGHHLEKPSTGTSNGTLERSGAGGENSKPTTKSRGKNMVSAQRQKIKFAAQPVINAHPF